MTEAERLRTEEIAEQLLKNKLLSSKNFLNYTNLTYEDIVTAINNRLAGEREFDNFRESAIAQTILEIFAGATDLINYYIERRAEESFFDTAKLASSHILLGRNIGYDVKRPIPAQCRIKVRLKGNLPSATHSAGDIIQIPQYRVFTVDGNNYILKTQFNCTLSASDLDNSASWHRDVELNEVTGDLDNKILLLQGERKTVVIKGLGNAKVGQSFQQYRIEDPTFSNLYGSEDLTSPLTQVGIGSTLSVAFPNGVPEWTIDRRTLLRQDSMDSYDFTSEVSNSVKICLIRTAIDKGVDLMFGDNKFVSKGLESTTNNIYIKYLSTLGSKVNKVGLIGSKANIQSTVTLNGSDITSNLEFYLLSNVQQGADLESNDSIRVNAPGIFATLDRVVTSKDYVTYLKTLSTPIPIKNAIAWGEQEELKLGLLHYGDRRTAIKKLFNVVLFSVIGSLYNTSTNLTTFSVKTNLTDENAVLDSDYEIDEINSQSYFNLYTVNSDPDSDAEDGGYVVEEVRNQLNITQGDDTVTTYNLINGQTQPTDTVDFTDWDNWKNKRAKQSTIVYYTSAAGVTAWDADESLSARFVITASEYASFDQMCTALTTEIRGWNIFPDDFIMYWDSTGYKFNMKYTIPTTATNKVIDVHDSVFSPYNPSVRLNRGSPYVRYYNLEYTNTQISYSNKITEVLNNLNKRSQLTIKNVYVSPIVQKFTLDGTVYVSNLIDKDNLQRQINNKVYSWLDDNADFGIEIYKSNIIELIESYPTVRNADVYLEPVDLSRSDLYPWFISGLDSDYAVISFAYSDDRINRSVYHTAQAAGYTPTQCNTIARAFESESRTFMNTYLSSANSDYYKNELTTYYTWDKITHLKRNLFANKINERAFYNSLAKPIYDSLRSGDNEISRETSDGVEYYYQSSLFRNAITDMHKDLLYIIRYNMLDSYGNIAKEYETQTVLNQTIKNLARGGYSLGNEIVQITMNYSIVYSQ